MNANHLISMRHRRHSKAGNSVARKLIQLALIVGIILAVIGVSVPAAAFVAATAVYNAFTADLPDPSQIVKVQSDFQTTKLYDRTGKLLYEIIDPTGGDRQWARFNDISPFLRCATVANEDRRFYETEGIDIRGL
ncbi:MAG: transglycosylase domain-containing protein, partial [Anaerolineae bacterium]|nr:transglycosylase domain-containing protein [Thermoflexales bacterium]MDW8407976.1 transglycosylase domain-containing protein [Anaerolineae bacterium]